MKDPAKLFVALKYYLVGRRYFKALKALDFGKAYHVGLRKDGKTPEFSHQVEIALYLSTLKDVQNEELVLTTALLHDVMEDYNVAREEIVSKFGEEVDGPVWLLTKKFRGQPTRTEEFYFDLISRDPVASLVKGADRINNVQSMIGVFTLEKQQRYIGEVEKYFLPMLKKAKYHFPEQTAAYFNIVHLLKSQVELLKALHAKA